jgi:hypothetical protein
MRNAMLVVLVACSAPSAPPPAVDAGPDPIPDAPVGPPPVGLGLGTVTGIADMPACPGGGPQGARCQHVQVVDCPGIETEALDATVAILEPQGPARGTILHFKGGGGTEWETIGTAEYQAEGFRQVYVLWASDWEQTLASGIKTAACRPATVIRWAFDNAHGASRDAGFCAQGKSGGAGQVAYALAHFGQGDVLDYVNEISGPPFSRIDLGCDGDAPRTEEVCGVDVTTRLPDKVGPWENMPPPLTCGSTGVPPEELERWRGDSIISDGAVYTYPDTRVEFWDCTNTGSAVTAMSHMLFDEMERADPARVAYHCYSEADGCQGEGLGTGTAVAIQAMIDGCIANHR